MPFVWVSSEGKTGILSYSRVPNKKRELAYLAGLDCGKGALVRDIHFNKDVYLPGEGDPHVSLSLPVG